MLIPDVEYFVEHYNTFSVQIMISIFAIGMLFSCIRYAYYSVRYWNVEGSCRYGLRAFLPAYCSLAIACAYIPRPFSIPCFVYLFSIFCRGNTVKGLEKEERSAKAIYISPAKNDALEEQLALMTKEQRDRWYHEYCERAPKLVPIWYIVFVGIISYSLGIYLTSLIEVEASM